MRSIPSQILIVDIAATAWETPKDQPAGAKNEIIEIGIIAINLKDLTMNAPMSILVKPVKSTISNFCTEITTLTQDTVDIGISFGEACIKIIEEMNSKKTPWVSWGDYDQKQFLWQCKDTESHYPFGAGHWNFRDTFAKIMGLENDIGIKEAVEFMGLEFQGTHHRACDDVLNTANIIIECFSRMRGLNGKKEFKEKKE